MDSNKERRLSNVAHGSRQAVKAELRRRMAALRDAMPPEERRRLSAEACRKAAEWLQAERIGCFMAYASFRSELDTRPLLEWGWSSGRIVLLPVCNPEDRSMTLHRVHSFAELRPGAYGLPEPDPARTEAWRDEAAVEAIFVPALAAAPDGSRLGYGGGYYDRLAARMRDGAAPRARWMGLCFGMQVQAELPAEPHDLRLDGYITEDGVFAVQE